MDRLTIRHADAGTPLECGVMELSDLEMSYEPGAHPFELEKSPHTDEVRAGCHCNWKGEWVADREDAKREHAEHIQHLANLRETDPYLTQ